MTRSTAGGVAWSYLSVLLTFGLQLVYTAVMSRLLVPADFGLVAAALLGLRAVGYLSRFGLGSAVVQRSNLSERESQVAFTVSVGLAVVATAVGVAMAPLVADLLGQSAVTNVMRWTSVGILLTASSTVPEGMLRRRLRFRALSVIQVVSTAIGFLLVGIPLAVRGGGVWSLVAASVTQAAVQFSLAAFLERGCLRVAFDRPFARALLSFGGLVAATGFLEFLSSSVDTFAVARWNGAAALGQYSRATTLVGLPIEQATNATSRVLLPSFARVQDDPARFSRGLLCGVGIVSLVISLPVALAAVTAAPLVRVVLGTGWAQAANVLPFVGAAYGISMLLHLPAVAAEARGLIKLKFRIQALVLVVFLGLVAAVAAGPSNLKWFGAAWVAAELVRLTLYLVFVVPELDVPRWAVLRRFLSSGLIASLGALAAWLVVRRWEGDSFLALLFAGFAGFSAGGIALMLPTSRVIRQDIRDVVSRIR